MAWLSEEYGLGWLPDHPSILDYTPDRKEVSPKLAKLGQGDAVREMLKKAGVAKPAEVEAKTSVDLRQWFSPVENQGSLGSCTANAAVGLVEYFERRAFGTHIDASRLFLYKATRNLMRKTGDTGAFLRTTMGALVLFGVPPEEYWPYQVTDFDQEPTPFCYAFAQNYQAISYYRLDPVGTSKQALLQRIKAYLNAGLPAMFGFTVYSSIDQAAQGGAIPYPGPGEQVVGGHAVVVAGYDDKLKIKNRSKGKETTGALLIRNSWGKSWGGDGYGWLPYDYVTAGLAVDWWSLLKNEWIETGQFSS